MKRAACAAFAVALLALGARADLVGHYTFGRVDPLEAVVGAAAQEGVMPSNVNQPVLSATTNTITLVDDASVLGGRGAEVRGASEAELARLVEEDLSHTVRPGGVDGSPFWNGNARWFMYAPSFDFPETEGSAFYLFRVLGHDHVERTFRADSPKASLLPVWGELPTGFTTVVCEARYHNDGWWVSRSHHRSFWKMPPFRPGAYPAAPRPYGEAARMVCEYLLNLPAMRRLVETGRPDPGYWLNCYPAKMNAAVALLMARFAAREPSRRSDAERLARACLDYLMSVSQPADAPLAFFPPTYAGENYEAKTYAGLNVLVHPAEAGEAAVALYGVTHDGKYLDYAKKIAATYLRLQGEDGTWYFRVRESDGACASPNRLAPDAVVRFMDALFAATGDAAYARCADRAFAFFENGPIKTWNWEGQFEDVAATPPYMNLTKHPACAAAIRLVSRFPRDEGRRRVARDILRFAEDQFVCWERPFKAGGRSYAVDYFTRDFAVEPAVVEQYYYRTPVDASAAKLVLAYLALYKAEGSPLDLAKARALGDSLVRMQRPDGRIPTLWWPDEAEKTQCDWLNCLVRSAVALYALADAGE